MFWTIIILIILLGYCLSKEITHRTTYIKSILELQYLSRAKDKLIELKIKKQEFIEKHNLLMLDIFDIDGICFPKNDIEKMFNDLCYRVHFYEGVLGNVKHRSYDHIDSLHHDIYPRDYSND